ncbi:MAG: DUF6783 domain-containing protein [Ruminococcus sp.]
MIPANCDAHLAESLFQTRSKTLLKRTGKSPVLFIISSYILCRGYIHNRNSPSRNYILTACKIIVQLLD